MGKRIVIALGGNALGNTPYEQLALVTETAKPIVDLIAQGDDDSLAHDDYLSFDFLKTLFSQKRLTKAADPPFYI